MEYGDTCPHLRRHMGGQPQVPALRAEPHAHPACMYSVIALRCAGHASIVQGFGDSERGGLVRFAQGLALDHTTCLIVRAPLPVCIISVLCLAALQILCCSGSTCGRIRVVSRSSNSRERGRVRCPQSAHAPACAVCAHNNLHLFADVLPALTLQHG